MNERIRELYLQAHSVREYPQDDPMRGGNPPTVYWQGEVSAKKFAELIVQECAELIDNKVTITAAQTYDEVFVARYGTKELCAKQIKEHFGIEE
jgi:hypothetical protein